MESLAIIPGRTGIAFEQGDLVDQASRYRHLAAINPVFRVAALRHLERNCSRTSDQSTSKTGIGLEPQSTKELNFAVVINKSLVLR